MPLADYPHLEKAKLHLDQAADLLDEEMNRTETLDASDSLHDAVAAVAKAHYLVRAAVAAEDGQKVDTL